MDAFLLSASAFFDRLERLWVRPATRQVIGTLILVAFVAALIAIELGRYGVLPPRLAALVPTSHFYAIDVAFTFLLLFEVVELVFGLARSVAGAAGKQFEILSLILLRSSFKELVEFPEPLAWLPDPTPVLHILSDAFGALLIFVVLGAYYHAQRHQPITRGAEEQARFVASKQVVALLMLAAFIGIGVYEVVAWVMGLAAPDYFATFYTVLIFSDVLIVLLALLFSSTYHVVFRNSGFAVATVMIRLALAAPPYFNALLGLGAALFALGLTLAYNRYAPTLEEAAG
jgi:hypothetical protein